MPAEVSKCYFGSFICFSCAGEKSKLQLPAEVKQGSLLVTLHGSKQSFIFLHLVRTCKTERLPDRSKTTCAVGSLTFSLVNLVGGNSVYIYMYMYCQLGWGK